MNGRKANLAFLITVVCYIGLAFAMALVFPAISDSLFLSNLLCELVVILPVFVLTATSREKMGSFLSFQKIKISTVLMTALFTFLTLPALSLFNLISQLWVENEVAAMMESQGQSPFFLLYLSMALIAPVLEEIACRGFFYRSYQKSSGAFAAMLLSALLFALVHMNFNQAGYAFVMGILSVLLVEATGSLFSSILYHGLINGSQALLMYGILLEDPQAYSAQAEVVTSDFLMYGIGIYVVLTAITLPLSWAVLVWMEGNEGRKGALSRVWRERKRQISGTEEQPGNTKKDKVITLPLLLAVLLCLGMMTGAIPRIVMNALTYFGIPLS